MMIDVDWTTLFKTFYEEVRIKVMCRDPSKIPAERLYEMEKKIFLLFFVVEGYEQILNTGTDGDDDDENGKKDEDDEADDLDYPPKHADNENNMDMDNGSAGEYTDTGLDTPTNGSSSNVGKKKSEKEDLPMQELQLVTMMNSECKVLLTAQLEDPKSNAGVDLRVLDAQIDEIEWVTPAVPCPIQLSDGCKVGLKAWEATDSSQKTKWERLRKMSSETDTAECSFFLRNMELEDSEGEGDTMEDEDMLSLSEAGISIEADKDNQEIEQIEKPLLQSTQKIWGPNLRVDRSRRFPEDGRTIAQKAEVYASYRNLETAIKPGASFDTLSNSYLNEMSNKIHVSFGNDTSIANSNIVALKKKKKWITL